VLWCCPVCYRRMRRANSGKVCTASLVAAQAVAALLNAALAYWATSTPLDASARVAAPARDPAALIGKLQLVAAGGDRRPRLAPAPAQQTDGRKGQSAQQADVTVAHLFLPELARQYGGGQDRSQCVGIAAGHLKSVRMALEARAPVSLLT
jgi:hypothetical protein